MIKKSDENSIHTTETAYDKDIRRMEEREAHILDNRAIQVGASVAEQVRAQQAPLTQALQDTNLMKSLIPQLCWGEWSRWKR